MKKILLLILTLIFTVNIYPSPAKENIQISNIEDGAEIIIYDIQGKKVLEKKKLK